MSRHRYAAFLRAVSPMNAKMSELARAFEAAGFAEVSTVASSGNVVFSAGRSTPATLQRKAERAMTRELGHSFLTIVRPIAALERMLAGDPFAAFKLAAGSKRVVTFLREPTSHGLKLPVTSQGARILAATEGEVFTAYVPRPDVGAPFMKLIEDAYGKAVTTRTWEMIQKVVKRGLG